MQSFVESTCSTTHEYSTATHWSEKYTW